MRKYKPRTMSAKTRKMIREKSFERTRKKVDPYTREWARLTNALNQKNKVDGGR